MWMPSEANSAISPSARKIWIWLHPASYKQAETEIEKVLELKIVNADVFEEDQLPVVKKQKLDDKDYTKLEIESVEKRPVWSNAAKSVKMTSLKDKLVRFKLLGPLASTILSNVLKPADLNKLNESLIK